MDRARWHEHVFQIARGSGLTLEDSFVPEEDFEGGWLAELAASPELIRRALEVVPHGDDVARRANRLLAEPLALSPAGHTADWAERMVGSLEPVYAAIYGDAAAPAPLRLENVSLSDVQPLLTAELQDALVDALEEAGVGEWPNALLEPLHRLHGGHPVSVWYCLVPYLAGLEEPWLRSVVEALEQWPQGLRATIRPVRSVGLGRWLLVGTRVRSVARSEEQGG